MARRPPPRSASPGSHDDDQSGRVGKKPATPAARPGKKSTPPPPPAPKRERRDPWLQLDDETDVAYEAFKRYRDMGVTRSTAKVAQALGKSKTLMDRWSSRNQWVIRTRAWEGNEDREWLLEQRSLRRRAAKRNSTAAALAMQKFGEFVMQVDPTDTKLYPPDTMIRLAQVAVQIERTALGMDLPGVPVTAGGDTGAVDADTIAGMSDEDRQARLRMLLREAQARLDDHDPDDDDDEEVA